MNLVDMHGILDDLYNVPNKLRDEVISTMPSIENNNEDDSVKNVLEKKNPMRVLQKNHELYQCIGWQAKWRFVQVCCS